jgi:exportin-2 (importin alpha re-exporter)
LKEFSNNEEKNWKSKDIAIYIATAVAVKAKTEKKGATKVSDLINITDFLGKFILSDLKGKNLILKTDAIKYITTFRNQLPKNIILEYIFPLLIELIKDKNRIISTYSAWSIERILFLKEDNNQNKYSKKEISNITKDLLTNIFVALNYEESKENEYLMKLLMRLTSVLQDEMNSYISQYLYSLTQILSRVCKNPTNPLFNHYIFESYATVIKYNSKSIKEFEKHLINPFLEILNQNIEDFTPYVFQILSQICEKSENIDTFTGFSKINIGLFNNIIKPSPIWENNGNIPGIIHLICIFIKKYPDSIINGNKILNYRGKFRFHFTNISKINIFKNK